MRLPALLAVGVALAAADRPPATRALPVTETLHGVTITDPYRWLEDQNSSETRAWIDAQNAYTRAYLEKIPARDQLKQRLTALMRVDWVGLPVVRNGRYFFSRRKAEENRASICMRPGFEGKDQVLVDPATVGDESYSIELEEVSEDGKLIAYGVRHGGEDELEVRLLDVDRHELLPFRLPRARYESLAIKHDRSGLFYSRYVTGQGSRVYYHDLNGAGPDREIFGSQYGPERIISASLSEDGRYLLIEVDLGVPPRKVELYLQDILANGPIRTIVNDLDAQFLGSFVADGKVFLWTDWKAPNRRILAAGLDDLARDKWTEVVPESKWPIESMSAAGGRLLVSYLENVKARVRQYSADERSLSDLELPGIGSTPFFVGRWKDDELFFNCTPFVEPGAKYRRRMSNGRQDVWYRPHIPVVPDEFDVRQV